MMSGLLPYDPELNIPYVYSTTLNRQEFQLAATLESSESAFAIISGDYKSVSRDILPTIVTATGSISSLDISANPNLFIIPI